MAAQVFWRREPWHRPWNATALPGWPAMGTPGGL